MLDQDNNLCLISMSILITCLLDDVWISLGEVTCLSLVGFKGLALRPLSLHLTSPHNITPDSHIKVKKKRFKKEMITDKKISIVKQILFVSTLGNAYRTVWRIFIQM